MDTAKGELGWEIRVSEQENGDSTFVEGGYCHWAFWVLSRSGCDKRNMVGPFYLFSESKKFSVGWI